MKVLARVGLAAALSLGGLVAATTPAQAYPSHCTGNRGSQSGSVYCYASASGSQFRAKLGCRHITPVGSEDNYTRYGPWRKQGDEAGSAASCAGGDSAITLTASTK